MFYVQGRGLGPRYGPIWVIFLVVLFGLFLTGREREAWVFFIAFGVVGGVASEVLRRRRLRLSETWLTVHGTVEACDIFTVGNAETRIWYQVEVSYSFVAAGEYRSGHHIRQFDREESAEAFVDAIKGRQVLVNYDPRDPETSSLVEWSLDALSAGVGQPTA